MSEFTKLGGYLIEGQPEVAHDNTLSGNGLEGSPLGLSEQVSEVNDLVHSNSGDWNRISALSGYSAKGWSVSPTASKVVEAKKIQFIPTSASMSPLTAYFGIYSPGRNSASDQYVFIGEGNIWLYNRNKNLSAQTIRPDTIFKWNNYASGKLDTTATANFYTTANESGFISEVPAGTMNESNFGYDASDNITGYNGSAFKAGDEFPQSATEAIETVTANSADWNGTTDTVSSNSGAWGGSALPISAGPGIKFEMVDNTLVASTDETVLFFAGNDSSGVQAGDLTESIMNFERIRVAGMDNDGHVDVKYIYPAWSKNADNFNATGYEVMLYGANPVNNTVWEKWTRYSFSALTSFNVVLSYEGSYTANTVSDVTNSHKNSVREVVGINRIAGGN